jgi:hypothetical protein
MDVVKSVVEVELTSSCVCEVFDEHENAFPSDECFNCWSDSLEDLGRDVLEPWLDAHKAEDGDYVVIDGENVGWLRRSGSFELEVNRDAFESEVLNVLTFDGDFRLVFRLVGDVLSVRRASHDEPMGASCVFRLVKANRAVEVM